MSISAHIHTKHEIEYGGPHLNYNEYELLEWLNDHEVDVYQNETDWEILKEDVMRLTKEDCRDANDWGLDSEELWLFIEDIQLNSPDSQFVYVSWF